MSEGIRTDRQRWGQAVLRMADNRALYYPPINAGRLSPTHQNMKMQDSQKNSLQLNLRGSGAEKQLASTPL